MRMTFRVCPAERSLRIHRDAAPGASIHASLGTEAQKQQKTLRSQRLREQTSMERGRNFACQWLR